MDIALTQDMEEILANEVASGRYPNAGEVIRDALRLFKRWSEARERELEPLRREIQAGIEDLERGDYTEYDEERLPRLVDDIRARGLERLAAERASSAND